MYKELESRQFLCLQFSSVILIKIDFIKITKKSFFFNKVSDPTFHVSMGDLGEEASPYNCFIECLRQNIILPGKPLTIGLSQGGICLCGHENSKNLKSNSI